MLGIRLVLFTGVAVALSASPEGKPDDRHVGELLSALFKRGIADPKSIPDGQLLGSRVVNVREEIGRSGSRVRTDALGGLSGWVLRPLDALQQEADAAGETKYFVVVESVTMSGDKAVVEWGTDLAIPKRDTTVIVVCCSLATDEYRKRGGTWVFNKRLRQIMF